MPGPDAWSREVLHRFEHGGKRYAIDVETCFCFECDAISWDVLEYYPHTTPNRIVHLLREVHDPVEVGEVISELEWLRATKSIIPHTRPQDIPNLFTIEQGVKHVAVIVPSEEAAAVRAQRRWFSRHEAHVEAPKALEVARAALTLLFARSCEQKDLRFELLVGEVAEPVSVVERLAVEAHRVAAVAGKKMTVSATVAIAGGFHAHGFSVRIDISAPEAVAEHMQAVLRAGNAINRLVKAAHPDADHIRGTAVLRPGSPHFADAVRALHDAGFNDIELDVESPFVQDPGLDAVAFHEGLSEAAQYYAERLLKNDYFRIEPLASLFARIYHGMPTRRTDPSGVQSLTIDAEGGIWPSAYFIGRDDARLGNVLTGEWRDEPAARFADIGVTGTSACMRCWARHLCGGGSAIVNQVRSGSFRKPELSWCDAQRAWAAAAVSAFNMLSSQGVHFTRIYQSLNRKSRPGFFQFARTALKMSVIMRPLAESDAAMLREWENWNEASYFLLKPNGTLLTTQYDREMDALYPYGNVQEMLLTTRRGDPIGLVKMKPDKWAGTHQAWLYLHRESDYRAPAVRSGFKELLKHIAGPQDIRRVTFYAAAYEKPLRDFLTACDFSHEGVLREALYLTDAYHDVHIHTAMVDRL